MLKFCTIALPRDPESPRCGPGDLKPLPAARIRLNFHLQARPHDYRHPPLHRTSGAVVNATHLTLIVAFDAQRGIGIRNTLPWHLPEDLAHFKRVTSGHPIIMGRKTFDSIGRPLPNRRNIVITRNPAWRHDGVEAAASLLDALALIGGQRGFIIGGAQVFAESMDIADQMIVTEIGHTFECDTFFAPLVPGQWRESARESHHSKANGFDYSFVTYDKAN
ncbi:diacylglycerol kinase [Massilia psychrophila]|uniref:dihydrofolate reductase n=1 Tax=Massilia psychrophila TaxID=1603353 RepID=A0A2G8T466_9BURK|nr:diacylglycerol kinase [Massilia psychrophila]